MKQPASLGILDSRPPGAAVHKGFEDIESGCWDDGGDAWIYAKRTYAFPGPWAEVVQHYRAAAKGDGWKPAPDSAQPPAPEKTTQQCFTRARR
ncbi:hypothetical protein [Streptomyces atratus]|uniref:hypothetical protein n=1 Tax=Streptomyces atratus TaxID=1893 RepID=UPI00225708A5|nr:hypothetical protein [Streptomyces atratus]MCX5338712.1 hypothetical protein [Streptomyces atratus]